MYVQSSHRSDAEVDRLNEPPALEAFSLTKARRTTDGESIIWRSPDIVVQPGQFVAILGHDPSNVQLLLGMLSGLVEPTGGVLRIDGQAAEDLPRPQRARLRAQKVGFLFREPKLLPDLSVLDNVILRQRYAKMPRQESEERGRLLLERLGLGDALARKPAELTEYEGQLVSLARALINRPAIILADEPMAALSSEEAERYMNLLRKLGEQEKAAIVLGTSHANLSGYADQTIQLPATTPRTFLSSAEEIDANDFFSSLYETEISPLLRPLGPLLDYGFKPLLYVTVVALAIVFLTFFGLQMSTAGQAGLSLDLGGAVSDSLSESVSYLGDLLHGDPGAYDNQARFVYWSRSERLISGAVRRTLGKSVGLLLLSMALGGLIGIPLGLFGALLRHRRFSLLFVVAAIVGVSTPSFFLALLLQILEVTFYRRTGISPFPVGGFGWDEHVVLPALVLAARPIAQVARVSFVALSEVLDADYIRTAHAKGLITRRILSRHALRNAGVPVLAALGTSVGFSLSSLPVVEAIFQWPGMGNMLLDAIRTQQPRLAATLALLLGIFFVIVHVVLDFLYRWVDPRLREEKTGLAVKRSWVDLVTAGWSGLREMPDRLAALIPWLRKGDRGKLPPLPTARGSDCASSEQQRRRDAKIKAERRRTWVQSTVGSLPFAVGGLILLVLIGMILVGQRVAPHSAYTTYPTVEIDGELTYAPFQPSALFPLGTDQQGRDILSLLLYGARRTMSLAFFAVLARILLGTILGALSGWFSDSLLDRVLMGLTQVIAAFPSLLMAMVLIYAFGIREGLWVFALALCLIGWGEAAQFVRSRVMHIREQDYVEGALATGLGDLQLLSRHVLPNLVPSLVVLAFLEMGGVLMLLGELGFIGVFIGGGTQTISATDAMLTYFDVPEWGVMLSNTWRSFRSYPWMTFYPALAFTLSIVGFNLFGEGLRRLTERLTLSMHRIVNKYTIGATLGVGALLLMAVEGTGSWTYFAPIASKFNTDRAMADVRYLASAELEGRRVEEPGLEAAAQYIANEFAALGLQPAGPEVDGALSYFVPVPYEYSHLTSLPSLELLDSGGQPLMPLTYHRDFAEIPDSVDRYGRLAGEVVCVAMGVSPDSWPAAWPESADFEAPDLLDKVILLPAGYYPPPLRSMRLRALLFVVDEEYITHRELATKYNLDLGIPEGETAYLFITPSVAEAILAHGGYSLDEVRQRQSRLRKDDGFMLHTGVDATISLEVSEIKTGTFDYVQAFIPGRDVGSQFRDVGMDREMVILLAHYDGLGRDVDGTLYPGANKNASGIAALLETARLLQEANHQPYRTVMFVAWAGEELRIPPSYWHMLRGRPGWLERYNIAAVVELIGVGAGTTDTLLLNGGTSGRLTEVLQQAARHMNVNASTLGTGIHGVYSYLYPIPNTNIPYISITWDGSHATAHTPQDTVENIEPERLRDAGRVAALALMYLGHEKEY
jgi:ABC-type dipeptide/oligopeptide/nickel transport system permease component/ABC-type lipoprotein export system ATPase subunit